MPVYIVESLRYIAQKLCSFKELVGNMAQMEQVRTTNKKERKPSIRIFKNPILEACTHVHPIVPLLLWTPVILYFFYLSFAVAEITVAQFIITFFVAVLFWSFFEYVMHRYLFHFEGKNRVTKYLVFLFHGLHHDDPNDPTRLVFPPVPAIAIVTLIYFAFRAIIPAPFFEAFLGSFLIGYLIYDYIHYATHHFPMTSKVGKYLRKFHLQHHFSGFDAKYGVSSPLWDYIFRTVSGPKSKDH